MLPHWSHKIMDAKQAKRITHSSPQLKGNSLLILLHLQFCMYWTQRAFREPYNCLWDLKLCFSDYNPLCHMANHFWNSGSLLNSLWFGTRECCSDNNSNKTPFGHGWSNLFGFGPHIPKEKKEITDVRFILTHNKAISGIKKCKT